MIALTDGLMKTETWRMLSGDNDRDQRQTTANQETLKFAGKMSRSQDDRKDSP